MLGELMQIELHRRVHTQARLERTVVNRLRMQLLIDPLIDPHRLDSGHIARPGPKGQPVQRVQRPLVLAQRRLVRASPELLLLFVPKSKGIPRRQNQQGGEQHTQTAGNEGHSVRVLGTSLSLCW